MARSQRSRLSRLVALVAIGTAALTGCGRGEESSGEVNSEGIRTTAGFDGKTISLGLITVTSGPLAPVTEPLTAAQLAWEKYVNANGGVGGYQVKLNMTDSAYNPAQAIQQYERTKGDVVMYANIFGTPVVQSLLPKLRADGILAAAGTGDGSLFRERELTLMFTPFESQVLENIDYNLQNGELGGDAVFCGAALEGPLYETVERALNYAETEMGVKVGIAVSVPQTATDATPQVLQLQSSDCDVVVVQAVNSVTTALAAAASKLGYAPQFMVTSTGYTPVFEDNPLYEYFEANLLMTADTVPFGDMSAAGMAALVEAYDKYTEDVAPTTPYVLGWVGMLAVQSILEEAIERKDLSHEGVVEASNALSTFDLQGIGPKWGWGEPNERTAPESYTVDKPDASQDSGMAVVQANVPAPDSAVNYPY
jgi:ABC-type branched-subunit amino acid transport system substrate-binding protein